MKPNFALSLTLDGIRLLHRHGAEGWNLVGSVQLDSADLAGDLAALREAALKIEPGGIAVKLVLPNDQIRYLSLETTRATEADVRAALEGATPYPVADLVHDHVKGVGRTYIAAVARETLAEAEAFAANHGFQPIAFAGVPEPFTFVGEAFFGPTALSATLLPPGSRVTREETPISWAVHSRKMAATKARTIMPPAPLAPSPPPPADNGSPLKDQGQSEPGLTQIEADPAPSDNSGELPDVADPAHDGLAGEAAAPIPSAGIEPVDDPADLAVTGAARPGDSAPDPAEADPARLPLQAAPEPAPSAAGPLATLADDAGTEAPDRAAGQPDAPASPVADADPEQVENVEATNQRQVAASEGIGSTPPLALAMGDLAALGVPRPSRPAGAMPQPAAAPPVENIADLPDIESPVIEAAPTPDHGPDTAAADMPVFAARPRPPRAAAKPPVAPDLATAPEPVFVSRSRGHQATRPAAPVPPPAPVPVFARRAPAAAGLSGERPTPAPQNPAVPGMAATGATSAMPPRPALPPLARLTTDPPPSGPALSVALPGREMAPPRLFGAGKQASTGLHPVVPPPPPFGSPATPETASQAEPTHGPALPTPAPAPVARPARAASAAPVVAAGALDADASLAIPTIALRPAPLGPAETEPASIARPSGLPPPPAPLNGLPGGPGAPALVGATPGRVGLPAAASGSGRGRPRWLAAGLVGGLVAVMALVAVWSTGIGSGQGGGVASDDATTPIAAAPASAPQGTLATPPAEAAPAAVADIAPQAVTPPDLTTATLADPVPQATAALDPAAGPDLPLAAAPPLPEPAASEPGPPAVGPAAEPGGLETAALAAIAGPGAAISAAEADRFYAATGVWLRAPRLPLLPRSETVVDMGLPLPTAAAAAASAAPALPAIGPDPGLPRQSDPPPPGTSYPRDERGNILATPEGTLLPSGVLVFAAAPPLNPPTRPGTVAPESAFPTPPEEAVAVPPEGAADLAAVQPMAVAPATGPALRPASVLARAAVSAPTETVAPEATPETTPVAAPEPAPAPTGTEAPLGGVAFDGLRPPSRPETLTPEVPVRTDYTGARPPLRPAGLAPEAPPAPDSAPLPAGQTPITAPGPTDVTEALVAIVAAAPDPLRGATAQAVAVARRPDMRPRNFDRVVARAQDRIARAQPAASPGTGAGGVGTGALEPEEQAETEPEVASAAAAAPSGPIPGGVAEAATLENAMALREINLIGVYGRPDDRRALVRLANGRYLRVSVGDNLDGGRVAAIGDNSLNYTRSGRTITLQIPNG